jgi:hypothetical protein
MTDENKNYTPIKNLRKRSDILVKNLRKKEKEQDEDLPSINVLIYRDTSVIKTIRDQITAEAFKNETKFDKIKKVVKTNPLTLGDYSFDGLAGVDEVVFKPTAKFKWFFELGADVQLKWNLGNDTNVDMMIQIIFNAMWRNRISVKSAINSIRNQKSTTPIDELIYPGMPINIYGIIRKNEDVLTKEINLWENRYNTKITFNSEHNLSQTLNIFKKRNLYVFKIFSTIPNTYKFLFLNMFNV